MGCTQSKIENEEIVTRCKERKLYMKDAVSARNAFAAAHSAYSMSLKNTGAALSDYAHAEVQFPNSATPSVPGPSSIPQPPYETLPPPPPLPDFQAPPLQRAASMPEFSIPKSDLKHSDPIIEVEIEDEEIELESHILRRRSSRSSGGGGGSRSGTSRREVVEEDENLPPPPSPPREPDLTPPSPPPPGGAAWDYFFNPADSVPGPSLVDVESRSEREELERKMFEGRSRRAEADMGDVNWGDGGKKSGKAGAAEVLDRAAQLPQQPQSQPLPPPKPPSAAVTTQVVTRVKQVVPAEGSKRGGKSGQSVNLLQIFSELDDCFLKASESAHEVSKMLEANRLHYHSNFADNRGITISFAKFD